MNSDNGLNPAKVDIIFFDAGGTLLYPDPTTGVAYSEAGARHGIEVSPEDVETSFRDAFDELRRDGRPQGRDWWRDVVELTFSRFGTPTDPQALFEELYDHFRAPRSWKRFPGTSETLATLRSRGYRTGLISNWDRRLPVVLDGLGLLEDLDPAIISALVGTDKPDPRIYEIALERAEVDASRALMIGDEIEADVNGPRAAGMQALRVDRSVKANGGPGVIGGIPDLLDLLPDRQRLA